MINWDRAIARNREALPRILAALFAMAGLAGGEAVATLPRHLRNHILRLLRAAESAVRRLIIIAARDVVVVVPARSKQATTPSTTTNHRHIRPRLHGPSPARSAQALRCPPAQAPREILPAHQRHRPFRAAPIPEIRIPSPDDPSTPPASAAGSPG